MFKNIKISTKITILIVAISLVSVLAISLFTYHINVKNSEEKIHTNLSVIADNKAAQLSHHFTHIASTINFLQNSPKIKSLLNSSPDSLHQTLAKAKETYGFNELFVSNGGGTILVSANGKKEHFHDPDGSFFSNASSTIYYSSVKKDTVNKSSDSYMMFVGAPLHG
ncbi:MAG: hypothetical protein ORN54_11425, partial [Cyclobacteriaceae bacterium]|nr:hypothetical protein [Cyclobacteriaceae bacterium]